MAPMVPFGIESCASRRSPERFEPAMIPVDSTYKQTHTHNHIVNYIKPTV